MALARTAIIGAFITLGLVLGAWVLSSAVSSHDDNQQRTDQWDACILIHLPNECHSAIFSRK